MTVSTMEAERTKLPVPCIMTRENIAAYIQFETGRGANENAIRRCRRFTASLFTWLPEDKEITAEALSAWRQNLKEMGYSEDTQRNYVKGINRYLDYIGASSLRFNRGRAKDIAGQQFGYLTAIEPTGGRDRRDLIWKCCCKCGKEVEYPATRLLTGNTLSCGCLRSEHLKSANKYFAGTSLRQSIQEQILSPRAQSGYTGVTVKRDKWQAYIRYKGSTVSLGCYDKLEDAVKARARGKELVQMDAMGLLDFYEELHRNDPAPPNRTRLRKERQDTAQVIPASAETGAIRSDNTSGCAGVYRKGDKWSARITHQKITYQLGVFGTLEQAAAVRKEAERILHEDPAGFPEWVSSRRKGRVAVKE